MALDKVKAGIIGCGAISGCYFQNMCNVFHILEVAACADLVEERAVTKSQEFPGVRPMTVDDLLADPDIDIVVNLTIPSAHAEIALKAIEAGKSVHNEKPLAVTREDGRKMLELAAKKGVLVGCAPDTFLGAGHQTARKVIDDGWIGEPVAATAFFSCRGHERWHPAPHFYYKKGGGPMFDMGPYYLTDLVQLIGPIRSVTGMTRITFPERVVTSEQFYGDRVEVEVPTHITGSMQFVNGALGTIVTSFDVWAANLPRIEVHGTEGSLSVPDPNGFGGPVRLFRPGYEEWREVPHSHIYTENSRGIGVADMAYALLSGRKHRTSGELAFHVLDAMHAFHDTAEKSAEVELESTCERPAAVPLGLSPGHLDK